MLRTRQFERLMYARKLTTASARGRFLGVASTTVSRIVAGDVAPSSDFVAAACVALGVDMGELFEIDLGRDAAPDRVSA